MWWDKWMDKLLRRSGAQIPSDLDILEQELWRAHRDWKLARVRMNDALEQDEIDYAIYMLEAAEKRYDMLLRKTKIAYRAVIDAKGTYRAGAREEGESWHMDG